MPFRKNIYNLTKAYAGVLSLNQPMHCQYFLEGFQRWFLFLFLTLFRQTVGTSLVRVPTTLLSTLNLCMAPEFCSHLAMLCLSLILFSPMADTLNICKYLSTLTQNSSTAYPLRGTSEFNCQLTTTTKPGKTHLQCSLFLFQKKYPIFAYLFTTPFSVLFSLLSSHLEPKSF